MDKLKCIILLNTDRIESWEKDIIDTISLLCDIQYFYQTVSVKKNIPLFYKQYTVKTEDVLKLYKNTDVKRDPFSVKTIKADFIFCLNEDFNRELSAHTPVIYINKPCGAESATGLKEFIRGNSYYPIGLSICYINKHYSLADSKLKTDKVFFQKNLAFIKQVLVEMISQSINSFKNNISRLYLLPDEKGAPLNQSLYHFDLLVCYLLLPLRLFKKIISFFCYWEQWHVGIVEDGIDGIISSDFKIDKVRWLPTVKKHQFIADPFGLKYNNRVYIFAELWDSENPVGKIVWGDESDSFSKWNTLFDHETHLSYPFLVTEGKKIYCLPESAESGDFTLYTAERFPDKWNKGEVLFRDFRMADASFFFYKNRYWLFTAKANGDSAFELYIWFSDKINGKWKAHPMNPVKRDITSARPAGPLFINDGVLYRPSQDCSDSYGCRIIINRIIVLNQTEFREETAGIIEPPADSQYSDGMHTFSVIDDVIVIDAKRKMFILFNYRILKYKIKRVFNKIML